MVLLTPYRALLLWKPATRPAAAAGRRPAASDEHPLHSGDGIRQFGAAAGQPGISHLAISWGLYELYRQQAEQLAPRRTGPEPAF